MEGNHNHNPPPPPPIKIPLSNVFTFDQLQNNKDIVHTKDTKKDENPELSKKMRKFYDNQLSQIQKMNDDELKAHDIRLARIKRIMKSDQDVKMISGEVPLIIAKACELFIVDLAARAWHFTSSSQRRIIQKEDIGSAVGSSDIFDFLQDIIEVPPSTDSSTSSSSNSLKSETKGKKRTASELDDISALSSFSNINSNINFLPPSNISSYSNTPPYSNISNTSTANTSPPSVFPPSAFLFPYHFPLNGNLALLSNNANNNPSLLNQSQYPPSSTLPSLFSSAPHKQTFPRENKQ